MGPVVVEGPGVVIVVGLVGCGSSCSSGSGRRWVLVWSL